MLNLSKLAWIPDQLSSIWHNGLRTQTSTYNRSLNAQKHSKTSYCSVRRCILNSLMSWLKGQMLDQQERHKQMFHLSAATSSGCPGFPSPVNLTAPPGGRWQSPAVGCRTRAASISGLREWTPFLPERGPRWGGPRAAGSAMPHKVPCLWGAMFVCGVVEFVPWSVNGILTTLWRNRWKSLRRGHKERPVNRECPAL